MIAHSSIELFVGSFDNIIRRMTQSQYFNDLTFRFIEIRLFKIKLMTLDKHALPIDDFNLDTFTKSKLMTLNKRLNIYAPLTT